MNLKELGWDTHFRENYDQYKKPGMAPARIIREDKYSYQVAGTKGELMATLSGKFRFEARSDKDFPRTGDWVVIKPRYSEGKATIQAQLPRKNYFSRKAVDGKIEEQIIAANVDTAFIMCGLDSDFNVGRIERYLILSRESSAVPVILLNKSDICKEKELKKKIAQIKTVSSDVPVYALSARKKIGIRPLYKHFQVGKTIVLLGSSGVGKSTLINSILKEERQAIQDLRKFKDRGKHTTAAREMIFIPGRGIIIDNPGFREVGIWTDDKALSETFGDIEKLITQCHFKDCRHESEPKCAVKKALKDGFLDYGRFQNYLNLQKELDFLDKQQEEKERSMKKAMLKKTCKKGKWR